MLILGLNSATANTEVAIIQNGKILAEKSWLSERSEGEKLLPAIQSALKKAKKSFKDLEGIFAVSGPGAFTGLRIGVSIANALAFSHSLPVYGCSIFDLLRLKTPSSVRADAAFCIKGGGAALAFLTGKGKTPSIVSYENLSSWLGAQGNLSVITADLRAPEQKILRAAVNSAEKAGLRVKIIFPAKQRLFGAAVQEFLKEGPPTHKIMEPVYLQKPVITKSKKEVFA